MQALKLTLHRHWFDQITAGVKKIEYRQIKPYWTTRLEGKSFNEVHFRNGYRADAPFMRVKFKRISKNGCYQIHLGKILEIKNYVPIKA